MSNSQHSFFFGKTGEALLGVYYAPDSVFSQRSHGVILCPAFGQEYLRSHRAFRQLGLMLARAGLHVMRFDYYGTGDSAGLLEHASISRWTDNISAARDELVNITGCRELSLVGLRLGATLGMLHAAHSPTPPWDSITLWEPVVNGLEYLRDFGDQPNTPIANVMGFPLTPQLRAEIAAIDLLETGTIETARVNCIRSTGSAELSQLLDRLRVRSIVLDRVIPIDGDWSKTDQFLSAMLPREMILQIVEGLTQPEAA